MRVCEAILAKYKVKNVVVDCHDEPVTRLLCKSDTHPCCSLIACCRDMCNEVSCAWRCTLHMVVYIHYVQQAPHLLQQHIHFLHLGSISRLRRDGCPQEFQFLEKRLKNL